MNVACRVIAVLAVLCLAGSCESPQAPSALDGRVVLRFDPALAPAGAGTGVVRSAAALFDSVAVRVFRGGGPLRLEVAKGAAIVNDDPVDVSVSCLAEDGKKVSVELFVGGLLVYHGADPDVDVAPARATQVLIDVSPFFVSALTVSPSVVPDGTAFLLQWSSSPAAESYRVQGSRSVDFASIEWEQTVVDTLTSASLSPGPHYFRVVPLTSFATGPATGPRFGYVSGGSGTVVVSGFVSPAVIPGETITVLGENLDFPGTEAWIGGDRMTIESSTWGAIVARAPRAATSNWVTVTSALGTDVSADPVSVQRVAFVTATGEFALSYSGLFGRHADDFGYSGVAAIPVGDLDWRDMDVFDIIVVANDTGADPANWGGDPDRANAIAASSAGVLAIGEGGATFVKIVLSGLAGGGTSESFLTSYYTSTPGAGVFTTPHAVTSGGLPQWVDFCANPERAISISVTAKPANANFYASTGIVSDSWVLADFTTGSPAKRMLFFGFAANPVGLTTPGQDCVANAMNLLYRDRAVIPAH